MVPKKLQKKFGVVEEHLLVISEYFGCIAYFYNPDQLRKKLDDKGEKCVFIGYSEISRTYRSYNLVIKKVIVSIDVTFNERGAWNWSIGDPKIAYVTLNYQ